VSSSSTTTSESGVKTGLVPLDSIRDPDEQHREQIDPDALGSLADSIAAEGLHQPIGVRERDASGTYELIFGHRRLLAYRLLGRPMIAARIYPLSVDVHLVRASENLNREQLNPVEEAHIVQLFLDRGVARAEIARRLRRSTSWVDQRAALLDLPADVLNAIRHHGLTLAVARLLADVDHESYRRQLLYEAIAHGATEATAAVWRQHFLADRDRIVSNTITVEQIIQDRQKYRLTYPCDWCDEPTPYEGTRTARLCVSCMNQLETAKHAPPAQN